MKFIKLTLANSNCSYYCNVHYLLEVKKYEGDTFASITLADGVLYRVEETPEQIIKLITEVKND